MYILVYDIHIYIYVYDTMIGWVGMRMRWSETPCL